MTISDKKANPCLSSTELGFIVLMSLSGLIANIFVANYMKSNFDLSKIIYKLLMWSCLVYFIGFIVMLITVLCLWSAGKVIHPKYYKNPMNFALLLFLGRLGCQGSTGNSFFCDYSYCHVQNK